MSTNGKGSAPRPLAVPRGTFGAEFDRIFGARCGRCQERVGDREEICWLCHEPLCGDCWEEHGHCGHAEANAIIFAAWQRVRGCSARC